MGKYVVHRYLFYLITALLSWVFRKKDDIIMVDNSSNCENLNVLLDHFLKHNINFFEIGKNSNLHPNTLNLAWYLARCRWVVIDCDCHYLGPRQLRIFYNINYFDVWHATGLKYILNDSDIIKTIWGYLWFGWKRTVIASGHEDAKLKRSGYGPLASVIITGSPQVDILKKNVLDKATKAVKAKILYAPSFFDINKKLTDPLIFDELEALEKLMTKLNAELTIKFHPLSVNSINLDVFQAIKLWDEKYTTNELLSHFDILISDYSGVICDFSLLGRPVIIINNSQLRNRQLWYSLDDIFPSSIVNNYEELKSVLELTLTSDRYKKVLCNESKSASRIFHNFQDYKSCKRVIKLLDKNSSISL